MRSQLGGLAVAVAFAWACEGARVGVATEDGGAGGMGVAGASAAGSGASGVSPEAGNAGANAGGRGGSLAGAGSDPGGKASSGGSVNQGGSSGGWSSGGGAGLVGSGGSTSTGGGTGQSGAGTGGGTTVGGNTSSGGSTASSGGGGSAGSPTGGNSGSSRCTPLLSAATSAAHVAPLTPGFVATTDARACWRERTASSIADHLYCVTASGLVGYDFQIHSGSSTDYWELSVSDDFVLHLLLNRTTQEGTLDARSLADGSVSASVDAGDLGAIALDGAVAYFFNWASETLMKWQLPGGTPSAVATSASLGLDINYVMLATALAGKLYVAESRRIVRVDPNLVQATPVLDFSGRISGNPPVSPTSGSLIASRRGLFFETDSLDRDDYYVAFSGIDADPTQTPFLNLKDALQALAMPAGCAPGGHYPSGQGTLYPGQSSDYYVYPAAAGLFAVAVGETGIGEPQLLVAGTIESVFGTRQGQLWADYLAGGSLAGHTIVRLEPPLQW